MFYIFKGLPLSFTINLKLIWSHFRNKLAALLAYHILRYAKLFGLKRIIAYVPTPEKLAHLTLDSEVYLMERVKR